MRSYDSDLRGSTRLIIGVILITSSVVGFFGEYAQENIGINILMLVIGIVLTSWGYFLSKKVDNPR